MEPFDPSMLEGPAQSAAPQTAAPAGGGFDPSMLEGASPNPEAAGPPQQDLGFRDIIPSMARGLVHGAKEVGQTGEVGLGMTPTPLEEDQAAAPLEMSDFMHPGRGLSKLGYMLSEGWPTIAGGVLGGIGGGAAGTMAAGPVGGTIGGIGGGIGGAALAGGIQTLGQAYAHELTTTKDRDAAFNTALKSTLAAGAASGASWALFPVRFWQGPIKHLIMQSGIQGGIGAAHQGAENVIHDRPVTEGMGEAFGQGAAGTAALMAGHMAVGTRMGTKTPTIDPLYRIDKTGQPTGEEGTAKEVQKDYNDTAQFHYGLLQDPRFQWDYRATGQLADDIAKKLNGQPWRVGPKSADVGPVFDALDMLRQSNRPPIPVGPPNSGLTIPSKLDFADFDRARQELTYLAGQSKTGRTRGVAGTALQMLDDWFEDPANHIAAGMKPADANDVANIATTARRFWQAKQTAASFNRMEGRAERSNQNYDDWMRREIGKMVEDDSYKWKWPSELRDIAQEATQRGWRQSLGHFAKNADAHSSLSLIPLLMAFHELGPAALAMLPAARAARYLKASPMYKLQRAMPRAIQNRALNPGTTYQVPTLRQTLGSNTANSYSPWNAPITPGYSQMQQGQNPFAEALGGRIRSAAIRHKGKDIYEGPTHSDAVLSLFRRHGLPDTDEGWNSFYRTEYPHIEHGFVTDDNRYLSRGEAMDLTGSPDSLTAVGKKFAEGGEVDRNRKKHDIRGLEDSNGKEGQAARAAQVLASALIKRGNPKGSPRGSQEAISAGERRGVAGGNRQPFVMAPADRFHAALIRGASANKHGASVAVHSPEQYAGMRTFLSPDEMSGYALEHGNNIVSVFKHPNSKIGADEIMRHAVANGGRRLDAFDTALPGIYSRYGFRATARTPFVDQFAPRNWDYNLYNKYNSGRPDIVFMAHDPQNAHPYQEGEGQTFGSYDEADAYNREQARRLAGEYAIGGRVGMGDGGDPAADLPGSPFSPFMDKLDSSASDPIEDRRDQSPAWFRMLMQNELGLQPNPFSHGTSPYPIRPDIGLAHDIGIGSIQGPEAYPPQRQPDDDAIVAYLNKFGRKKIKRAEGGDVDDQAATSPDDWGDLQQTSFKPSANSPTRMFGDTNMQMNPYQMYAPDLSDKDLTRLTGRTRPASPSAGDIFKDTFAPDYLRDTPSSPQANAALTDPNHPAGKIGPSSGPPTTLQSMAGLAGDVAGNIGGGPEEGILFPAVSKQVKEAVRMAAAGRRPDEIWEATGAFKDFAGNWRREALGPHRLKIPMDQIVGQALDRPDDPYRLKDMLDAPHIFEDSMGYPLGKKVADLPVHVNPYEPGQKETVRGFYRPYVRNLIPGGRDASPAKIWMRPYDTGPSKTGGMEIKRIPEEDFLSTLYHETQHAVDQPAGVLHTTGGDPYWMRKGTDQQKQGQDFADPTWQRYQQFLKEGVAPSKAQEDADYMRYWLSFHEPIARAAATRADLYNYLHALSGEESAKTHALRESPRATIDNDLARGALGLSKAGKGTWEDQFIGHPYQRRRGGKVGKALKVAKRSQAHHIS